MGPRASQIVIKVRVPATVLTMYHSVPTGLPSIAGISLGPEALG